MTAANPNSVLFVLKQLPPGKPANERPDHKRRERDWRNRALYRLDLRRIENLYDVRIIDEASPMTARMWGETEK